MKTRASTLAAMACCCASGAATGEPLVSTHAGAHLTPIRAAFLNEDFSMKSGWIDYETALRQRGGVCALTPALMYDCFGVDSDGITPIGGDTECGLASPSNRWNFPIDTSCFTRTADNFTVEPGFEGGEITRITGAFAWYGDGNPANSEQCFVAIQIWDDIDDCTGGPDALTNFVDFVIIDLGVVQNNPGFYYTYDIDVCALNGGSGIPVPADGAGGVDIILAQAFDAKAAVVTLATCAQPMLWGTAPGRPGSKLDQPYWRDENQDFALDPTTECFTYDMLAPCPDELGSAVALFGTPSCASFVCGDTNCDSLVTLPDVNPFIQAHQDLPGYEAAFPSCDALCTADTNADVALTNFDILPFINTLTSGSDQCGPVAADPTSVRVFLAEEGLSNPGDTQSAAVTPSQTNPAVLTDGVTPTRLYLWVDLLDPVTEVKGLSFNVHTTGSATITGATLYNNTYVPAVATTWNPGAFGVVQATDTSGDGTRWSGANAIAVLEPGASNGAFTAFDQHYNTTTGSKLLGHIEVVGDGDVFLEIGDKGIATSAGGLPGPSVSLGYGDEADGLNGASFGTPSSLADATLTLLCVGDLNGDGVVDTADLGLLIGNFGMSGMGIVGDINGDGTVDTADLGLLVGNFGSCLEK